MNFPNNGSLFQYISCYCLSCPIIIIVPCHSHFNTSHVTVYLSAHVVTVFELAFQYISCYCLSGSAPDYSSIFQISIHLMLLFIGMTHKYIVWSTNFNTSHVTVYREGRINNRTVNNISIHLMLLFIFTRPTNQHLFFFISIHLMLLFIFSLWLWWYHLYDFNTSHVTVYLLSILRQPWYWKFQYISCYCLSLSTHVLHFCI